MATRETLERTIILDVDATQMKASLNAAEAELGTLVEEFDQAAAAGQRFGDAQDDIVMGTNKSAKGLGKMGVGVDDLSDGIGQFARDVAGGDNALLAFGASASQLAILIPGIGLALGVALAVLGPLVLEMIDFRSAAEKMADAQEEINKSLSEATALVSQATSSWQQLIDKYGEAADEAQRVLEFQAKIKLGELMDDLAEAADDAATPLGNVEYTLARVADQWNRYNNLTGAQQEATDGFNKTLDRTNRILEDNGYLSEAAAHSLLDMQAAFDAAEGDGQEMLEASLGFNEALISLFGSLDAAPEKLRVVAEAMLALALSTADAQQQAFLLNNTVGTPLSLSGTLTPPKPPGTRTSRGGGGGGSAREEKDILEEYNKGIALKKEMLGLDEATVAVMTLLKDKADDYTQAQIDGAIAATQVLAELEEAYERQNSMWDMIGSTFEDGIMSMIDGSKSVKEAFRDMATSMFKELFRVYVLQQLIGQAGGGGIIGSLSAKFPTFGHGAAFNNGNVTPFAKGGVVGSATAFSMGGGVGVMGEAGPEAIMPLSRNSSGDLGVAGPSVTVNNYTGHEVTVDRTAEIIAISVGKATEAVRTEFARSLTSGQGTFARSIEAGTNARRKAT